MLHIPSAKGKYEHIYIPDTVVLSIDKSDVISVVTKSFSTGVRRTHSHKVKEIYRASHLFSAEIIVKKRARAS